MSLFIGDNMYQLRKFDKGKIYNIFDLNTPIEVWDVIYYDTEKDKIYIKNFKTKKEAARFIKEKGIVND